MNIEESNLTFVFPRDITVSKFDDGKFYRKSFGKMPGGKGVDIIADSGDMLQLIEIKNCKGHEQENRWRTSVDNSKVTSAPATLDVKDRDSLDIEVAKKVASTIACLYGAWTKAAQSWRSKTVAYSTAPLKSSKQRLLYVAESTTETLQLSHDSLVRMLS